MTLKKFNEFNESAAPLPSGNPLSFEKMIDKDYPTSNIRLTPLEIKTILNSLHSGMWRMKYRGDKRWSDRKLILESILKKLNQ